MFTALTATMKMKPGWFGATTPAMASGVKAKRLCTRETVFTVALKGLLA